MCLATSALPAQSTAQLSGAIRDATGQALEGVAITVTCGTPSVQRRIVTDVHGGYAFDALPATGCILEALLAGFERLVSPVDTGRPGHKTFDAVLTVSSVVERVTVTARGWVRKTSRPPLRP